MNEVSPCKGCPNRYPGCHARCNDYKEWADRYHAQKQHLEDCRYRLNIPMSPARERTYRKNSKFGLNVYKQGGSQ